MTATLLIHDIVELQQATILRWYQQQPQLQAEGFLRLVEENHLNNFLLWGQENKARRDDCGFEYVYHAKRAIDGYNQQRNNMMEAMDQWVYKNLAPKQDDVVMHSETLGMMIDRLSILNLKRYHMALQTERKDVESAHREQCLHKLKVIDLQLQHLAEFVGQFLEGLRDGRVSFNLYSQFKMYNDPSLNPEIYQNKAKTVES